VLSQLLGLSEGEIDAAYAAGAAVEARDLPFEITGS
jgi:hypothetical protein